MNAKTISDFDPSPYLTLPRMPMTELLTLVDVLVDIMPQGPWPEVEIAAKRVRAAADDAEGDMVERIRDGSRFTREDVKFDGFVDGVWGLFRDRLAGWARYNNDGRHRLEEDEELEVDLEELEQRAERGTAILEQLFAEGLDFTRRNYNEQSQMMANLLGVIDAEALDDELHELTGDELLPLLRACQRRYEAMVSERLSTDKNTTIGDLNKHRALIQRYVYFYTNAVIGTLNQAQPNTVESVEAALLPIINVRLGRDALLGRRAGNAAAGEGEPELVQAEQASAAEPDAADEA